MANNICQSNTETQLAVKHNFITAVKYILLVLASLQDSYTSGATW